MQKYQQLHVSQAMAETDTIHYSTGNSFSKKRRKKKGTTGNFSDRRETSQNRHNCTLEKNEITTRNPIN